LVDGVGGWVGNYPRDYEPNLLYKIAQTQNDILAFAETGVLSGSVAIPYNALDDVVIPYLVIKLEIVQRISLQR